MLFADAIDEFIQAQSGVVGKITIDWYRKHLRPLAPLGVETLETVAVSHLRSVWAGLAGRTMRWENSNRPPKPGGLSPFTLDGYYRAWRTFFNWCVEQEYIVRSPLKKLKRPRLPAMEPKAVAESDLAKMLGAATSKRDYALLALMVVTGCRLGGAAGLRMRDVDLQSGRVWVTEKGRGGGKRRAVYVHGEALDALKDYLRERRDADDPVFTSKTGKPLTAVGVSQVIERIARRVGVTGRSNPHSIRHRFAREMLNNGCDLGALSQLMGHVDPGVTIRFYGRWADNELQEKARRFSRLPDRDDDS